ncbi:hypothetical protein KK083_09425 [Fulvivirgaceae bacterium PWU4]|uniref:Uncharacterized protein n=1 Tax=Chryseosolibacter histidini TaxID=2782349 RepID=A0AAP2DN47_9BACT|nr:hypothetical protein [Chryseosolibacter histidini]MBT1697094.1 hypothetical protein [Chryseosolibacter histidini]
MTDKERKLRQIIADFENRKLDEQSAIDQIKQLTGETVDAGYLSGYWASESLDEFIGKLLVEPIRDWQEIDDDRAITLIAEIMNNVTDHVVISRNSLALERRYGKPNGTVVEKVFHDNLQDPVKVLQALKKETRIFL